MKYSSAMDRDANFQVIGGDLPFRTKKTITFAGGTTDAIGDDGGALDPFTIFTVTGLVKCVIFGVCSTDLAGANATLEVGISGATAIFGAQITATNLDVGEIYLNDTTPASYFIVGEEEAAADNLPVYILNGNDVIGTVTTADITSGVIDFYAMWRPLSDDAEIVAA